MDEIEIPYIYYKTGGLAYNKNNILTENSICQKTETPPQTEIPERYRDYTLSVLFRIQPLYKKPHKKHKLTCKTYCQYSYF
jgi:hypothetical protein